MTTFRWIKSSSANSAKEGEPVAIISRDIATSESTRFFLYAEQIANLIFPKLDLSNGFVDRFLIIIHSDASADVYTQDFQTQFTCHVNRSVASGEPVRRGDLASVDSVQFPGVQMVAGDRMIYFDRIGWRFGIAFDLSRQIDAAEFGNLCASLQAKLLLDDILQITLEELRKAAETEFDAFIITEGKTDWRHLDRALREIGYKRKIRFDISDQDRGDVKLLDICQALALEPRTRPVICVFDRDNDVILKRLASADPEQHGYQNWGNNVYLRADYASMAIKC